MFITFEGPEGAGKSTAIAAIADRLRSRGLAVCTTREPGAGDIGRQIRDILLHGERMPTKTELFLFLADRSNHVETVILPALEQGEIVICDRYADSTYVYQALVRGLNAEFVAAANDFATGTLEPTITFLLDVPAEVGLARLVSKDRMDREPLDFHQRVREGFLSLARARQDRWRILDATQAPERIVDAFFEWFDQERD
jgi:dTMP kinase